MTIRKKTKRESETWHEGIFGNVGVLGEKWQNKKSENPSCAANHTENQKKKIHQTKIKIKAMNERIKEKREYV